ncbi:MAG TPA: ATP-dependent RecD-like DNA helicase [Candidatus Onthousia faecavium]|nr:ATP-dependent RecD-like DNA helicase [Candidatus Onthousia faecavium]
MSKIIGNYKKTIFSNSTNSYLIGLFKVKEASNDLDNLINKTITITGYLPLLNEIDTYSLEGKIITHKKYGEQFEVSTFERIMPKETDSIINVLASDMFKGIGRKTAEKIVEMFKDKTFETILNNPNNLLLVKGVSEKQVRIMHEALKNYQGNYETVLNLSKLGFTTRDSLKIYSHYKDKSFDIINKDVYKAYYEIDDITYRICDAIFLKNNSNNQDILRLRASIIYILRELTNTLGHTYFYLEEINNYFPRVLSYTPTDEDLLAAINSLILDSLLVVKENKIYLKEYYDAEIFIARRLRLLAYEKEETIKNFEAIIKEIELKNNITYNKEQQEAILLALANKTLVITGGPGTGKTTIIEGIIDTYQAINNYKTKDLEENMVLLAPTGRAAKRMSEATNFKASTIHRFLKWNKDTNKFQVNEYNKSKANFVIIDEASMLDTMLFCNLLKGLSSNTKLIIVGDANQLPSVGAGNVLSDLITSDELKVIALKNLYRQGKDSNIITFAHNIKEGLLDLELFVKGEDLEFIKCADNKVLEKIKEVSSKLSKDEVQVLAPIYKTVNGIDNINKVLQELYNKKIGSKKELIINDISFREGDKVIQLSNMPDDNVFNGDIGIIDKIKLTPTKELYIDFDGNYVKYTASMFNKFNHAYAISIHKSQGSEFPIVIIPVVKTYSKMLYRKLIYTGVTRSKKKLILIGDINALALAIKNNSEQKRRTSLDFYLKNGII